MIVETMTPEEVYREIEKDMPNLSAWWSEKRRILTKRALKLMRFPVISWYEYNSHRNNRYLAMSIILGRKYNSNSMTAFFALQRMERGYAIYTTRMPWQYVANKIVVLPHAFERFRERMGCEETGLELIKRFFKNNSYGEPSREDSFSGRSVRYKGRNNTCSCMTDGVLLGEERNDIFIAHTFITYDMAKGLQRVEFDGKRKEVLDIKEMHDCICAQYGIK